MRLIASRPKTLLSFLCGAALLACAPFVSAQTALPVQWMVSPVNPVQAVAYSTNSSYIFVGGPSGLHVYNANSGNLISALPTIANKGITAIALSPNGNSMVTVGTGENAVGVEVETIEVWNLTTGVSLGTVPTSMGKVNSVAYTSDSSKFVLGGSGLEIWNMSGSLANTLTSSVTNIAAVATSPDGTGLAVAGPNGNVGTEEIWNLTTLKVVKQVATGEQVRALAYAPNSLSIADVGSTPVSGTSTTKGVIEIRNSATGAIVSTLPTASTTLYNVAFSPDGLTLFDSGWNSPKGLLESWNLTTSKQIKSYATTASVGAYAMALSPDGTALIAGGQANTSAGGPAAVLESWNVSGGTANFTTNPSVFTLVNSMAFSPDGTRIANGGIGLDSTGAPAGSLNIWSSAGNSVPAVLKTGAAVALYSVGFSPDGKQLAAGGLTYDKALNNAGVLEIWNTSTNTLTYSLPTTANQGVNSVAYSTDGKLLVAGGTGINASSGNAFSTLEVWNTSTGKVLSSLNSQAAVVFGVAISPDGSIIAAAGQSQAYTGILELWNPSSKSLIASLSTTANGALNSVAITPDSKFLVAGGYGIDNSSNDFGVLEYWNLSTHALIAKFTLASGTTNVYQVALSPDGSTAYVATDLGLQVFAVSNQQRIGLFNGGSLQWMHDYCVAVTPDNKLLGTVSTTSAMAVSPNPFYSASVSVSSLTLNPTTLQGGGSSTATITLPNTAPVGGLVVPISSNNAAASVPSTVTVAGGSTTATFTVNTTGVSSSTSVTITAGSGNGAATAGLTVNPATLASVSVSPSSVGGGTTVTGTVTLSGVAGPNGATVSVTSNSPAASVLPTAVVAAGQSTGTFTINTNAVVASTTVTISATLGGQTQTATLTVTPATLSGLTISPSSVGGGTNATGTVVLSGNAPTGGFKITLTSNNSAAIVPATLVIAAGQSTSTFTVKTTGVSATKTATITAKNGTTTKTATLTINPPSLTGISVTPTTTPGGAVVAGVVTLSGLAPSGGISVKLSSTSAAAPVPAWVTVLAGKATTSFIIRTTGVAQDTNVTLTATFNGVSQTASLTLTAPKLVSVNLNPTSLIGGATSTGTVLINGVAGTGGLAIGLSSNAGAATLPSSVTIPAGKTSVTFIIKTVAVAQQTVAAITANLNGSTQSANLTIKSPGVKLLSLAPSSVTGGKSSTGTITLSSPAPTGGFNVTVTSSSGSAKVQGTVTILGGKTTGTFTITTSAVTQKTTATISASGGGTTATANLTIS